ncbi:hypothetical protein OS493_004436 [Desmophyllum pertusum]|uniref:Rhodanese domain-containing protein n=1 Tax=Desmophyllum pertusum TaxID=174260 RepID=A0A9W9ZUJ7_9CNID|nr:hypothetical protein OS493_004436 [Desmophyllum pertusum]
MWVQKSKMAMKLATEAVKVRFPSVPNISTEELCHLMKTDISKRKLLLLDVREEKEFHVSHICNALHVSPSLKDMESVMKIISETGVSSEDVTVVCYCSVGYRSSSLAQQLLYELHKPSYQEMKSRILVYNLEGSIFKWANEGKGP